MASLLIEKLEILKSNEIKLKEEQRVLEEQIELEMEKKRRMKMDATLTKLEVQIDEMKNIKGWWENGNQRKGDVLILRYVDGNNKNNIVPLFRTMMGIMEKQQREIDELKGRF